MNNDVVPKEEEEKEVAAKELNEEQDSHVINSDHRFQSDFYHVHSLSGAQEVTVRLLLILYLR